MDKLIRKISVGVDYPKNVMSWSRDQEIRNKRTGEVLFTISDIVKLSDTHYQVFITNKYDEVSLWKEYVNMPVSLEFEAYL